jgi:hypothetical protein
MELFQILSWIGIFTGMLIGIPQRVKAIRNHGLVKSVPHTTPFGRMDEVKAARELVLCCWLPENYKAE